MSQGPGGQGERTLHLTGPAPSLQGCAQPVLSSLGLAWSAHPEGLGPASPSASLFLFKTFSAKQPHKPHLAPFSAGGETHSCSADPVWRQGHALHGVFGVLSRFRAVGYIGLAETGQGAHAAHPEAPQSTPAWLASCSASCPPRLGAL